MFCWMEMEPEIGLCALLSGNSLQQLSTSGRGRLLCEDDSLHSSPDNPELHQPHPTLPVKRLENREPWIEQWCVWWVLPGDTQHVRTTNAERFTAEHLSLGDLQEPAEKLHEGSSDLTDLMCSSRVKPALQPAPLRSPCLLYKAFTST